MNFKQAVKKFLAEGDTKGAIKELTKNITLLEEYGNEIILLSSQYNKWRQDYRLGLGPKKSVLNRINFSLLEIIDKIETHNDIENNTLNSDNPIKPVEYSCLYNSNKDLNPKIDWTFFNTVGLNRYSDSILIDSNSREQVFKIKAHGEEELGMEKPINRLMGFVELDYMAINSSNGEIGNLLFILIPMKHNTIGQVGYIEVGSDKQDDPGNPFSPYRKRFIIPMEHVGDQTWHRVTIEFDFRYIEDGFYTIFAPRVNEGMKNKGKGELWFKNIKIFG
jgi:hypothetical protein